MDHAYCLVCDKKLQITKNDVGVRIIHDGMAVSLDIDEGSRYRRYYGPASFLTKLISCNHITAFLCDDCLEKKQNQCYGTKVEVKRIYEDVFPDEPLSGIIPSRVAELEEAIRWVVTQQADDLCWMDVYVRLGKLVGVEITLEQLAMLPERKMLDNCTRYVRHLHTGCGYKPEGLAEENERLRAENEHLRIELVRIKYGEGRIDGSPGESDRSPGECHVSR